MGVMVDETEVVVVAGDSLEETAEEVVAADLLMRARQLKYAVSSLIADDINS